MSRGLRCRLGMCIPREGEGETGIGVIGNGRMFFFYFNKLGWSGSILVSVILTLVVILAIRMFSG
jgi:hypothetical protein